MTVSLPSIHTEVLDPVGVRVTGLPILCQTTGPPSPVCSCSRPSAVSPFSSPTFHLALLTNW